VQGMPGFLNLSSACRLDKEQKLLDSSGSRPV
jgi:hypothetical protein